MEAGQGKGVGLGMLVTHHNGCRGSALFSTPALANVGAPRLFAHRRQVQVAQIVANPVEAASGWSKKRRHVSARAQRSERDPLCAGRGNKSSCVQPRGHNQPSALMQWPLDNRPHLPPVGISVLSHDGSLFRGVLSGRDRRSDSPPLDASVSWLAHASSDAPSPTKWSREDVLIAFLSSDRRSPGGEGVAEVA
jgi:hypothetical protein